ncbi:MAG: hypothetical protein ACK4N5_12345 [Myxococcales bacterium]
MTTTKITTVGALLLAVSLCACGNGGGAALLIASSDAVGSNSSALGSGTTPTPPPTFQSSDGLRFSLTEARVNLRDIRIDLPPGSACADVALELRGAECKNSGDSHTIVVAGPLVVDLLTGKSTPDLSALRIPAGTYKRIDFRLDDGRREDLPAGDELVDRSFVARAEYQHEGQSGRLELLLKFNEDARFQSDAGVVVEDGATLLAMLRPEIWLEGLPLKACLEKKDVEPANGVLRLDDKAKGDCSDAENLVKRNIKRSGDLRKPR